MSSLSVGLTPISTSRPPSAAITAFFRGLERRAQLVALVQAGQVRAAQAALAATERVFCQDAEQWPIAQWPLQYWRLLLSVPSMGRTNPPDANTPLQGIARLPATQRAAVLLHLAAALNEEDAAAVLGVSVATYQHRIREALPKDQLQQPDIDVWRAWQAAIQRELKATQPLLPPTSHAANHSTRQTERSTQARSSHTTQAAHRAGWGKKPWLWAAMLVCIAAFIATFFLPKRTAEDAAPLTWTTDIQQEVLPEAPPAARFTDTDLDLHPDARMLRQPQTLALAQQLPLLAWYAHHQAIPQPTSPPNIEPPLPHEALAQDVADWDALPQPERRADRAAWAEWHALPATEQARLQLAASQWQTLSSEQQQALQTQFSEQSFDAQRGWRLGPQLGRDWPRIAALFTYIEPEQRSAILQVVRALSEDDIATLARLAQTTPPQARAQLRANLLAQPATQRSAWLQAQLQR